MTRLAPLASLVTLVTVACVLPGCLEREERITVRADGSLDVRHEIHGDRADLDGGAARLPAPPHFATRRFDRAVDDKTERVLEAAARFRRAEDVPTTFAAADDPLAAAALTFSTTLVVRDESDRTVYLFVRRYRPRAWARYHHHFRRAIPEELEARCKGTSIEDLPDDDRRAALRGLADYERRKVREWMRLALDETTIDAGTREDAWLTAARAVDAYHAANLGLPRLEALLAQPKAAQQDAADAIERDMERHALDAAMRVLGPAGVSRRDVAYRVALAHEAFRVTDDLGDEAFTVRVEMPGRLVDDNGDAREGNTVRWAFDGNALRDRTVVLVARSVVTHAKRDR